MIDSVKLVTIDIVFCKGFVTHHEMYFTMGCPNCNKSVDSPLLQCMSQRGNHSECSNLLCENCYSYSILEYCVTCRMNYSMRDKWDYLLAGSEKRIEIIKKEQFSFFSGLNLEESHVVRNQTLFRLKVEERKLTRKLESLPYFGDMVELLDGSSASVFKNANTSIFQKGFLIPFFYISVYAFVANFVFFLIFIHIQFEIIWYFYGEDSFLETYGLIFLSGYVVWFIIIILTEKGNNNNITKWEKYGGPMFERYESLIILSQKAIHLKEKAIHFKERLVAEEKPINDMRRDLALVEDSLFEKQFSVKIQQFGYIPTYSERIRKELTEYHQLPSPFSVASVLREYSTSFSTSQQIDSRLMCSTCGKYECDCWDDP